MTAGTNICPEKQYCIANPYINNDDSYNDCRPPVDLSTQIISSPAALKVNRLACILVDRYLREEYYKQIPDMETVCADLAALLKQGADPDLELLKHSVKGHLHMRLLHKIVEQDEPEIAKVLLEAGANTNLPKVVKRFGHRPENLTALQGATARDSARMVELLLRHGARLTHGANPDRQDGEPPLITAVKFAVQSGKTGVVSALLAAPDALDHIDDTDHLGRTAMHYATRSGGENLLGIWLDTPDINLRARIISGTSRPGKTPLADLLGNHEEWTRNTAKIALALLKSGALLPKGTPQKQALHLILDKRTPENIRNKLLALEVADVNEAGEPLARKVIDVNAVDGRGRTVLHDYASRREPDSGSCRFPEIKTEDGTALKRLLAIPSINVNARDAKGCEPIHQAAYCWDMPAVRALLEAGANPNARADDGSTPLDRHYAVSPILYRSAHFTNGPGRPYVGELRAGGMRHAGELAIQEKPPAAPAFTPALS